MKRIRHEYSIVYVCVCVCVDANFSLECDLFWNKNNKNKPLSSYIIESNNLKLLVCNLFVFLFQNPICFVFFLVSSASESMNIFSIIGHFVVWFILYFKLYRLCIINITKKKYNITEAVLLRGIFILIQSPLILV
jgi:hypothetical protein